MDQTLAVLPSFGLTEKVVLVTGAARGIGRATALACAAAGADIALGLREQASGKDLAAEIEKMGRKVLPLQLDVTKMDQIGQAVERALVTFGRIDVLVNNVGVGPENPAEKVTEEEIRHLVAEGHEQGVIDEDERNMLNRVLRLGDRSAESLMTPRTRIVWLDTTATLPEYLETMRETPYSRFPVYRGSDSEVVGVLETKHLPGQIGDGRQELFGKVRPALFVSESTNALKLLEIFREEQQTMALVVDEYGDIQGLVSLNDLLGAVLGRVQADDNQDSEPLVVERDDGSWLVDGRLSTEELRELLGLNTLPGEDENDFTTLAGMVIARYGRIPHAGEHFDWKGWRIEVVDLDGARIDKVLIERALTPIDEPEI